MFLKRHLLVTLLSCFHILVSQTFMQAGMKNFLYGRVYNTASVEDILASLFNVFVPPTDIKVSV